MDVRTDLWLLARLFSSMRFSMKSTASTLRAVAARCPVNRPMPAPSSRMRFSSTHPSIASTWQCIGAIHQPPNIDSHQPLPIKDSGSATAFQEKASWGAVLLQVVKAALSFRMWILQNLAYHLQLANTATVYFLIACISAGSARKSVMGKRVIPRRFQVLHLSKPAAAMNALSLGQGVLYAPRQP